MAKSPLLNTDSLRKQVYEYLKKELNTGNLKPGDTIDQKSLLTILGVSKTPFRDSLIRLEAEGFVQILPCKGVIVKRLSIEEIRNIYEIAGALECVAVELVGPGLTDEDFKKMDELINEAESMIREKNFSECPNLNEEFHDIILDSCNNTDLVRILKNMRARLYDFPKRGIETLPQLEAGYWNEHKEFLNLLKTGKIREAGEYMKRVHWSFEKCEKELHILYTEADSNS